MSNVKTSLIYNLDHHSLLFIGDREDILNKIKEDIVSMGIDIVSNPDIFINKYEMISVSELRDILEKAFYKSFKKDSKRIFIISFANMAVDAQNVFLKSLEEPAEDVVFILIAPENNFIETFLSRMKVSNLKKDFTEASFLEKSLKEKLDFVANLSKDISSEKKSKDEILVFLDKLEKELSENTDLKKHKHKIQSIFKARESILKRGAMIKMILENLVLQI